MSTFELLIRKFYFSYFGIIMVKVEVVSLQVIPEFPIALLVLASTVCMLVIFTAKTHRLIQSAR